MLNWVRITMLLTLAAILSIQPVLGEHIRLVQCTAPRSPQILVDENECHRLWNRTVYLEFAEVYDKNWDAFIENKVRGQELVHQFFESLAGLIDITENFMGEAALSSALGDTAVDLTAIWVSSLPVDEDTSVAILRDLNVMSAKAVRAIVKSEFLGEDLANPYDDFLRLANDFGFLVNEMRITRWRYTQIVIDDYLFNYFVNGHGHADVATAYRLDANTSRQIVFDAIYDNYNSDTLVLGVFDQGYNRKTVEQAVNGMIDIVVRTGEARLTTDLARVPKTFPQVRNGTLSVDDALRLLSDKFDYQRYSTLRELEPKLSAPLSVDEILSLAGSSSNSHYLQCVLILEPTWPPLMSAQEVLKLVKSLEGYKRYTLIKHLRPYLQDDVPASSVRHLAGDPKDARYPVIANLLEENASLSITPESLVELTSGVSGYYRYQIIQKYSTHLPYVIQPEDVIRLAGHESDSHYPRNVSLLSRNLPVRINVDQFEQLLGATEAATRKNLENRILERVETIE